MRTELKHSTTQIWRTWGCKWSHCAWKYVTQGTCKSLAIPSDTSKRGIADSFCLFDNFSNLQKHWPPTQSTKFWAVLEWYGRKLNMQSGTATPNWSRAVSWLQYLLPTVSMHSRDVMSHSQLCLHSLKGDKFLCKSPAKDLNDKQTHVCIATAWEWKVLEVVFCDGPWMIATRFKEANIERMDLRSSLPAQRHICLYSIWPATSIFSTAWSVAEDQRGEAT